MPGQIVDQFVIDQPSLNSFLPEILSEQEKNDGRFPCRSPGCNKSFKYKGKRRRDNELTHDPPPIIPEKPVLSSNYPKKGLFSDLDDDDVFSYKLCLTLYIRIHMSCSLLLYHHGHFPFTNSCWSLHCLSLNTARSPRSCTLSILWVSEALQICHTKCKCGRIAALKRCNLASVGIRFLSFIITPVIWLAFITNMQIRIQTTINSYVKEF